LGFKSYLKQSIKIFPVLAGKDLDSGTSLNKKLQSKKCEVD